MNHATEFVLWLNGASDVIADTPTKDQWAVIRERLESTVGRLAAERLSPSPINIRAPGVGVAGIASFGAGDSPMYAASTAQSMMSA
jgi:hypothetical protein